MSHGKTRLVLGLAMLLSGTALAHPGHDPIQYSDFYLGLLHPWLGNWQHPLVALLAGFAGGYATHFGRARGWAFVILAVYALLHLPAAGHPTWSYATGIMIGSAPLFIAAYFIGRAATGKTRQPR